MKLLLDKLLDT